MIQRQYGLVWGTLPCTRHHPHSLWRINNWLTISMCFTVDFEKARLTPSTHSDLHFTHSPTPPATPPPPSPTTLPAFKVCVEDVNRVFRKQKSRKASGPDGISPACLKVCADQLAPIFTQIFNRSQELCEVPCCFKRSTIIPVPKKPKITGLNDYLRDWSWPTWRTSLDPCWILFSLPTEQTGLWMTLSIWDCITSCNTSTNLGIT